MEAELVSEIGPFQKAKKNPKTKLKASRYSQQAQIAVPQHTRTETAELPFSLNASRQEILQAALKSSLTSGFIDTQFFAFTRRTISGFVVKASPIFANSIAMRSASPKFDHLRNLSTAAQVITIQLDLSVLMGGFSESAVARMNSGLYCDQQVSIDTYGYESGSDMDDDDERPDEKSEMDIVQKIEPSDIENDSDMSKHLIGGNAANMENVSVENKESKVIESTGRTIFVRDMAYNTWQALVFYVYTGKVAFAPLRSQAAKICDEQIDERARSYQPPRCSPKSMYRLADKYDLQELKSLAIEDIRSKLSTDNILKEVFSRFTSRYSEIQQLQIELLCSNCLHPDVLATMPRWMERVVKGDLPCCGAVLVSLIQALATRASVPASNSGPTSAPAWDF